MALDKKLFKPVEAAAPSAGGTGNQEEGLILHLDANDVDSYDGDGSVWYDITNHEYKPATNPSEHFNTVLFSPTSSGITSITGVGFQPDLVWTKNRDSAWFHQLYDSVRGGGKNLYPNDTYAENSPSLPTSHLDSLDSDGFTVDYSENIGDDHVAWCLKAGGAPSGSDKVSIDGTSYATMTAAGLTDGTEPISKLSVNTKLGFSIVKYTAPALTGDTVAHGLGETPEMIIHKSTSVARNWNVFHKGVGTSKNMHLNTTDDADTGEYWTANSTTFSIQDYSSSADWIAYCFTSKRGVSKVGSYKGTGAAGNKIYTGFEPAFVMTKRSSTSGDNWNIIDNVRDTDTDKNAYLRANGTNTETNSSTSITFNRDGFTLNGGSFNTSGQTHIYLAFAKDTNETELYDTDLKLHLDAASYSGSGSTWTADTGSDGTITGAAYDEELGDWFDFDGVDDKVIFSGGAESLTFGDSASYTIESWVYNDSNGRLYSTIGAGGGAKNQNAVTLTSGVVHIYYTTGTGTSVARKQTSTSVIPTNKWSHLAITQSGTTIKLYVNGEEVSLVTGNSTTIQLGSNIILGSHGSGYTPYFDGKIGQFRAYSSVLSQNDIRQNFNFTKNDYPNGFDGTLVSSASPTFSTDHFDFVRGSITSGSDQVVFDSNFHSYLKSTNEGTITAWIKVDAVNGRHSIFATGHTSDNNDWAIFRTTDSRTLHFSINNGGTANGFFTTSTTAITTGSYIHVAMSVDSEGIGKMYINGVSQSVSYQTGSSTQWFSDVNTNTVTIGSFDRGSSGQFYDGFDGEISQVKFYNRVLSDQEISDQHTAGR